MTWQKTLQAPGDLDAAFTVPAHFASGFAIGVIAVDLRYPKLPGNVANATTFAFPVLYERVDFPIEQLFAGDPAIKDQVVGAARRLEAQGGAGDCGRLRVLRAFPGRRGRSRAGARLPFEHAATAAS